LLQGLGKSSVQGWSTTAFMVKNSAATRREKGDRAVL
jgi:hypothetical protein